MPGKLDLRAGGDGSAAGAEVSIDGVVRGTVPNTFDLFAGKHQIEVRKAGYKSFSEWVDISEEEPPDARPESGKDRGAFRIVARDLRPGR